MSSGLIFIGVGGAENNQITEFVTVGLSTGDGGEQNGRTVSFGLIARRRSFAIQGSNTHPVKARSRSFGIQSRED